MRKYLSIAFFTFQALYLLAQTDTAVFNNISKVEANEYVLSIPMRWQYKPSLDASSLDRKFEFTGVSLPAEINHTPVVGFFQLRRLTCAQLKDAEEYALSEFTLYPDRITPPGYNYETDSLIIASGEKATVFLTHYFRRTKASNYTRYDMVVYSTKRKAAYLLTATFQYRDATYEIESNHKFKEYMYRVFRSFLLR